MTHLAGIPILAAALLAVPAPRAPAAAVPTPAPVPGASAPDGREELRAAMRKLWEDHVTWTRLYIVSAVAGLPDQGAAAARLLQNQADLGDAIKPFYGEAAGTRLTSLLRQHILIAADLVSSAKAANDPGLKDATARWYANADSIAAFLGRANPANWPEDTIRENMHRHLDLTIQECVARLKGDWAGDVAAYDAIHRHILMLADLLSAGIIAQFPDRVR